MCLFLLGTVLNSCVNFVAQLMCFRLSSPIKTKLPFKSKVSPRFEEPVKIFSNFPPVLIFKIDENFLDKEELTVFGNLPYNISTEILSKWILNLNDKNL